MNREEKERTKAGWKRPPPKGTWVLLSETNAKIGMRIRWMKRPHDAETGEYYGVGQHDPKYDGVIHAVSPGGRVWWGVSAFTTTPSRNCADFWAEVLIES